MGMKLIPPTTVGSGIYEIILFETIGAGTGGTITPPDGATIQLDAWSSGVDAILSTMSGGRPELRTPTTAGGAAVTTTLDVDGNYSFSGTPASYPVALIYSVRVTLANYSRWSTSDLDKVLEIIDLHDIPTPTAGDVLYGNAEPRWVALPAGTAHQLFKMDSGGALLAWSSFDWDEVSAASGADMVHDHSGDAEGGVLPASSIAHNVLSAAHTDAATAALVQGDILYVDATPELNRLAHPGATANHLQTTGAATLGWSQNITMADGATIGQAVGPLVAFDDTNNYLEITGCDVGINTTTPWAKLDVQGIFAAGRNSASSIAVSYFKNLSTDSASGILSNWNLAQSGGSEKTAFTIHVDKDNTWGSNASTDAKVSFDVIESNTVGTVMTLDGSGNVGIGTTSPDRLTHAEVSDAGTNAVVYAQRLSHITSGTAAAGFGTGIEFELEGADGTNLVAGAIETLWTDASTGAEDSDMVFKVSTGGAVASEVFRIGSDDSMSFFGVAKQAQQAHIADADGTLADITTKFNTLLADLEGYGLLAAA